MNVAPQRRVRPPAIWRMTAVVACLSYLALTLVLTRPLITHLATFLPNDLGDPLLNTWIIWWNAHAVPLTGRWWNAPIFWPATGAFASSEHLLGLAPLTTPFQWLGGSAVAAYNIAYLASSPVCAMAMYALTYALTQRPDAAFIAGLIFGFHPYRVAHVSQLQMLSAYWMVIALLALHQYLRERNRAWLCLFGAAWLLQALSNGYYLLFFPTLLGLWIIWFGIRRDAARSLVAIIVVWIVASAPLAPILWKYRQVHALFGFHRFIQEIELFSADVTSLLDASSMLTFWGWLTSFHRPEGELFPGLTAVAILGVMTVTWLWTTPRPRRWSKVQLAFVVTAIVAAAAAISAIKFGFWSITIGKVQLLSVGRVSKPLTVALVALAAAVGSDPRVVAAWRRRSLLLFYLIAALAMFVFALGPEPRLGSTVVLYDAPYGWLLSLPGFEAIRVPARFAMLAFLCLSVAAGLAFARLTAHAGRVMRRAAIAIAIAGAVTDGWYGHLDLVPVPTPLHTLNTLSAGTAVMELPLGQTEADTAAMYRSTFHKHPVVNGYSGFFPPSYGILRRGLSETDQSILDGLCSFGPVTAAVNEERDIEGRLTGWLRARPRVVPLGAESGWRFFSVPRWPDAAPDISGERLRIASVSANFATSDVGNMNDGNLSTRWASGGPQAGSEVVTVDLGSVRNVADISLALGSYAEDYPRMLAIDSSMDGTVWTTEWKGQTAPHRFIASVQKPRELPLIFGLPHVSARFLRLRQLGSDPVYYWSIAELGVFGR